MKKKLVINLKSISRWAGVLILVLILSGSSYVVGKYQTKNLTDFKLGVQNELTEEESKQKIERTAPKEKNVDMELFWFVWDELENNYLFPEEIDYSKMVDGAITGMVSAVGDPYTAYYPPAENKTFKENMNGSFFGVGIQLGYRLGGQLAVVAPITGMPGEKAGIKAGDFILKIVDKNKGVDKDTYGMSLQEAVELIRGEKGTEVTLTLFHDGGDQNYEVTVVRDEIVTPSVEVKFGQAIEGNFTTEATASGGVVAHLQLSRFGELTDEQWDQEVDKILARKDVEGVVLDVRNNPGGLVTGAVSLAAEFLPRGVTIVKQEERINPTKTYKTQRLGKLLDMPLIVLMNKGSASASEIIAGALREHKRAKLVGTVSFGKGTMQSPIEIVGADSNLHVTTARWLTPLDNWVHEKGLEPDVVVELDKERPMVDTQMLKAVEMIKSGEWKIEN